MARCIVCHKREAVLPDRNTLSMRPRVCRECHAERLHRDLRRVMANHDRKRRK